VTLERERPSTSNKRASHCEREKERVFPSEEENRSVPKGRIPPDIEKAGEALEIRKPYLLAGQKKRRISENEKRFRDEEEGEPIP